MRDPFEIIFQIGVVPVITIDRIGDALPLADALLEGGLPLVEITFRTSAATEAIAKISSERKELLVGAGTILDKKSLEAAVSSGATFGLAPGFDRGIVEAAAAVKFPFAPGVLTPTDLTNAVQCGVKLAKFFPAVPAGGPSMLSAISAPFAHTGIRFCPTGGITFETLGDWLTLFNVTAVGGAWIAPAKDIREGNFKAIRERARAAVERAKQFLEKRR